MSWMRNLGDRQTTWKLGESEVRLIYSHIDEFSTLSWFWSRYDRLHRTDGPAVADAVVLTSNLKKYMEADSPYELDILFDKPDYAQLPCHWYVDGIPLPFDTCRLSKDRFLEEFESVIFAATKARLAAIGYGLGYLSQEALSAIEFAAVLV